MTRFLLAAILLPGMLFAQTFRGSVHDASPRPIAGALVSLLKADSSLLISSYTDTAGAFMIPYSGSDAALLYAEAPGYTRLYQNARPDQINLMELSSPGPKELKAVAIVARKPLIEFKADRSIFNVEQSISASGGDAVDAIKRAPGTQVTQSQISLAGKGAAAIMINGRLQQLAGEDLMQLLHSISADHIATIEVITAASAKYDAEGNSGIINIILKKNKQQGFRGNIGTAQEYNMGSYFPTGSVALYYQQNKLNLSATLNGGRQGYPYRARIDNELSGKARHQQVAYPYLNPFGRAQITTDYAINSKSNLGFSFAGAFSELNNKERMEAQVINEKGLIDSTVSTYGFTRDRYPAKITANGNYEYRLDSGGKKINLDLDYFHQQGARLRDLTLISSYPASGFSTEQISRVSGPAITGIIAAKADLSLPLPTFKLNFGVKVSRSENDLDNRYEQKIGNEYRNDSLQTNRFRYEETIGAAYGTVGKSIGHWELLGGLRLEHTRGLGTLVTTGSSMQRKYTNLFPSATIIYKLNDKNTFTANFSRRISRPNYSFFNPFRFYYAPDLYSEGNPALRPSFNYISKLGYRYGSLLQVSLFYNRIYDYYDRVFQVDSLTQTSAVSRRNLGNKQVVALETEWTLQPASFWELNGSINGGYVQFSGAAGNSATRFSGFNWWVDVNNSFYLNKKRTWAAELSAFYYSPRQRDYVYWAEMKSVSFAIRCQLLEKKLTITLAGEDVFATSYWLQTNEVNGTREYSYDGHAYRLSIRYNFGNKNVKSVQQKSLEEIQRAN